MPTYAAPVLPNVSGLSLGSPSQRWNIYANLIDGGVNVSPIMVSSASMNFTGYTAYEILLASDVTSSIFSGGNGYYVFIIIQDGVGGHLFTWPTTFVNAAVVLPTPGGSLTQLFFYDSAKAYAVAPGMVVFP